MGDALGTYFEAARPSAPSPFLEEPALPRVGMALLSATLLFAITVHKQLKLTREQRYGLALEFICEATVYMSGVGADWR